MDAIAQFPFFILYYLEYHAKNSHATVYMSSQNKMQKKFHKWY